MIVRFNFVNLKMHLCNFISLSLLLLSTDGFTVKGPSGPLVVPLGASVLLPCSVDTLSSIEDLEVQWRRSDSETLVHLYQDGDIRPEAQQQEYHDRAHFFTDNIKHGNFSLLLENVKAEDEGEYTCKVYSGHDSAETVVEITCEDVERLIVSGSNGSISAYVGEDVTLSCSVNSHIPPEEIEEVSWKKTDKDGDLLVLLYQNNKAHPDSSDEQYRDRVEFFTDEIHRGNFSLRLKSVRTEDKGVYMCQAFAGELSANTTVILERMGFSALHIMVLILCITACGSAVIICCLIYCRPDNTGSVLRLQMLLVFCPNIIMILAFVLWGVSEGSVNESIFCCALYILRPLMLLSAAPYINEFAGKYKSMVLYLSFPAEYIFFTTVVYSVLFKSAWQISLNYTAFDRAMIVVLFSIVLLFCLVYIIYLLGVINGKLSTRMITIFNVLANIIFYILPSLQFILLFYSFGSTSGGFIIVAVLPVITAATRYNWNDTCGDQMGCSPLVRRSVWSVLMLLMNAVLIYFYIIALENEKDRVGWACTIGFLQMLWTVWNVLWSFRDFEFTRIMSVYVFGSVGVVLISAVSLMTELILKTVNGEGLMGDLRVAVFSSESLFSLSLLILLICAPWIKKDLQCCQKAAKSNQASSAGSAQNQASQNAAETPAVESNQNQNTAESHEMNPLLKKQEAGRSEETEKPQPDSVETQT